MGMIAYRYILRIIILDTESGHSQGCFTTTFQRKIIMEKFKLSVVVIAGLLSSSIAFAGTNLSSFYSSMHPKTDVATLKTMMHPPTDVTIVNASSSYIYAGVFGTTIHDFVKPGFNDHIYNYDANIWYTPLLLEDPSGNYFFNQNVCRLAVVTVYGYPGNYRINTDSELCN